MPAYRGWPPGRPGRGRDGDLAYLCLPLVGPLPRARPAGLVDRPSRAHRHPRRTPAQLETQVLELRRTAKLGPARIAPRVGLPPSTVYRVLCRHRLNRLAWMDRPTGQLIRRYERAHPGELVHMDIKKLGRIPRGGGHRVHGRDSAQHRGRDRDRWRGRSPGYDYIHAAIDDHTRLAYAEVLADEQAATCAGFLRRAGAFFAAHHIAIQRVLTDNAMAYRRSAQVRAAVAELGAVQRFTRPYRPQTNGKVCEDLLALHRPRSDPGQGMTMVSCVRFVDRCRCSVAARTGQTDLT